MSSFYKHQIATAEHCRGKRSVFDMSDPGTGKTVGHLLAFSERKREGAARLIVSAPKSILYPAWGNDIERFFPGITYVIATATNREKAFRSNADIIITNHDAAKWMADNKHLINGVFTDLDIDEITAFKHRTSSRSKSMLKLTPSFQSVHGMSGSPMPVSVTEVWHPTMLIDNGERLGLSFWKFRSAIQSPESKGFGDFVNWVDKPGAPEVVASLLSDITIRHRLEACIDIPPNTVNIVPIYLEPGAQFTYERMKKDSIAELKTGEVTAVHAASRREKLLQIASGSVYDGDRIVHVVSTERYELAIELGAAREQCVIAFLWKHQRDALVRIAEREGHSYAVIDGDAKDDARTAAVNAFQAGELKFIFAHPKSAAHGLTLTRGTTTIWPSPTQNAEWFQQLNARIYRNSQTQRTETILIAANNTIEPAIYAVLQGRLSNQTSLLDMLEFDLSTLLADSLPLLTQGGHT